MFTTTGLPETSTQPATQPETLHYTCLSADEHSVFAEILTDAEELFSGHPTYKRFPLHQKLGTGGGEHHVLNVFQLEQSAQAGAQSLLPIFVRMVAWFAEVHPEVTLVPQQCEVEHRSYLMGEQAFEGKRHFDDSSYTIVYYYYIDPAIEGGSLSVFAEDGITQVANHQPQEGQLVCFSGLHQVNTLKASKGRACRKILTFFINGGPNYNSRVA